MTRASFSDISREDSTPSHFENGGVDDGDSFMTSIRFLLCVCFMGGESDSDGEGVRVLSDIHECSSLTY